MPSGTEDEWPQRTLRRESFRNELKLLSQNEPQLDAQGTVREQLILSHRKGACQCKRGADAAHGAFMSQGASQSTSPALDRRLIANLSNLS